MELGELLQPDVESIGTCINERLLNTLTELIVQRIKGKSQAARPEWFRLNKSDLYKQVESNIVTCLNRYLTFAVSPRRSCWTGVCDHMHNLFMSLCW